MYDRLFGHVCDGGVEKPLNKRGSQEWFREKAYKDAEAEGEKVVETTYISEHHEHVIDNSSLYDDFVWES